MTLMMTPAKISDPRATAKKLAGTTTRINTPTRVPGMRPAVINRKPRTFIELRSRRAIITTIGMVRIRSVAGTASGRISVMAGAAAKPKPNPIEP
jgi:hypothetical protein